MTGAQAVLLIAVTGAHPSRGGILFLVVLVGGLGYHGSRLAWGLLVLLNGIPLLASAAVVPFGNQQPLWANVTVLVLTGVTLESLLLSGSMRRYLTARRTRRATA
jgi:hypothetical protein